jgi:alkyl sulfatase BDS1-like metallo-beta-lactamase superfamily hydrolase
LALVTRYLSPAWFDALEASTVRPGTPAELVLQQVVTGGPDGEVRYYVELRGSAATLSRGNAGDADMTFTSDYGTATAIARGTLSTQAALLEGRIRVTGSPVHLAERHGHLSGLDPIPAQLRAETTY